MATGARSRRLVVGLALAGLWLLAGVLACEDVDRSDGGLAALTEYPAQVDLYDPTGAGARRGDRRIEFVMSIEGPTHATCASVQQATVRFNGQPIRPYLGGGWSAGSTNSIYGDKLSWSECSPVVVKVPRSAYQPLDGVLEIDGEGLHFAVGVTPRTAPPHLILTSVRRDGLVVRPQGLSAAVTRKDFAAVQLFSIGALPAPGVGSFDFVDGELRVTFAAALTQPARARLNIRINTHHGVITSCVSFKSCASGERWSLHLELDVVIP
jgi:hypothetical protein